MEPNTVDQATRIHLFRKAPTDGQALKNLVKAGLTWLRTNHQLVNALNVFPVPDGDTGTNMVLTMQAAYDEIADSAEKNIGKMTQIIAQGALMGARGNSGVILSQLWRGIARSLDEKPFLDAASLVDAFAKARDTAYKGVVRPVEGTILTVAKDIAAAAELALKETDDTITILERVVDAADKSVENTPELLSVLKEAGVVDAGGKGLFFILEGMLRYVHGQPLEIALATVHPLSALKLENTLETIESGQEVEVVVDFIPFEPLNLEHFYTELDNIGTSIQIGEGEGLYRMHIHVPTEKSYEPIEYIKTLGTFTRVTMENLLVQMETLQGKDRESQLALAPVNPGQIAVVAVSPGPGIARIFASMGVAAIVEGGQTMNPSTQEIVNAFEHLPTDKIIILPNNKNILLAAQVSADLTLKQVAVVPSHSIPQGVSAMLRFIPDGEFEDIVAEMNEALGEIITGEITTATRDASIDGVPVQEGQFIGLLDDRLVAASSSLEQCCLALLEIAEAENYELITAYSGENVSAPEVKRIVDAIRKAYPGQEVEHQFGGQPHYHFIISIE